MDRSIIEEGALVAPHRVMSADEAEEVAARVFGVRGSATRLATEKDDSFRLEGAGTDGDWILKVSNPAEPVEEIDFQMRLVEHVHRADPSVPVQRARATAAGEVAPAIVDRAGQRRTVRAFRYIPGTVLDSTTADEAELEQVGRVLGRLRLACAGFSHPSDSRVLAWDVRHIARLDPSVEVVTGSSRRSMVAEGLRRALSFSDRVAALRTQVVHNDFSRSNIIVDHDAADFVRGIIDFGDAVRTAIAIDVSTAVLNQLPATVPADHGFFRSAQALTRGYLRVAELTEEELYLVPHLAMSRIVARTLITLRRAAVIPGNAAYILRNTEQGWAQLEWYLSRSPDEVSADFAHHLDR